MGATMSKGSGVPVGSMRQWMVLLLIAATVSGCLGDDDADEPMDEPTMTDEPDGNMTQTVQITIRAAGTYPVNPVLDPAQIEVPAGATVELTYINEDSNPFVLHDWFLPASGAQTDTIASGESTSITFTAPAEPGEYPYWCAVGDHRSAGMEGVMVVA